MVEEFIHRHPPTGRTHLRLDEEVVPSGVSIRVDVEGSMVLVHHLFEVAEVPTGLLGGTIRRVGGQGC
jgi:hypothetical protein